MISIYTDKILYTFKKINYFCSTKLKLFIRIKKVNFTKLNFQNKSYK